MRWLALALCVLGTAPAARLRFRRIGRSGILLLTRLEVSNSNRQVLKRHFDASGSDLLLTLTGCDIDTRREVRVLVNDAEIRFLSRTPNSERGSSIPEIDRSLLESTGNTLCFVSALLCSVVSHSQNSVVFLVDLKASCQ